tara:strand:+ start:3741 stop:3962 length:222 start_codon:yes stop_codon:yes gene_type:complete
MERSKLSEYYSLASLKVHALIDELYESLHDEQGEPLTEYEDVLDTVLRVRKSMFEELDLIKSIVREFEEVSRG